VKKLLPILLLALVACAPPWQGSPIEPGSTEWTWLAEVDDLAADWRADPTLPSIDTPRCAEQLADLEVRTATEAEWIDQLRMCPRMPDGCMKGCGSGTCATGTVNWTTGPPRIYLSPGESADGHVWGPQGVVWRRP
jgi:hypothetical protein